MNPWKMIRPAQIAFPAVVVGGVALTGIHIALGLYPLAIMAALATTVGAVLLAADKHKQIARAVFSELGRIRRITPVGQPLKLRASQVVGDCAWGYSESDAWTMSTGGWVTPGLCRAAADSLRPLLRSVDASGSPSGQVACHCPLANRQVTFSLEPRRALA